MTHPPVPPSPVPRPPRPTGRVTVRIAADNLAVREALIRLLGQPPLCDLSDDLRGTAQIVMAEVLNNIVEHAYAAWPGDIDVTLEYAHAVLRVEVVDTGRPMPPLSSITGVFCPSPGAAFADLPEGGFGWSLINSLATGVVYKRRDDRNTLAFRIKAG